MTKMALIELYGRRFTPFARIAGFIATLVAGIVVACEDDRQRNFRDHCPSLEQPEPVAK